MVDQSSDWPIVCLTNNVLTIWLPHKSSHLVSDLILRLDQIQL